MQRLWQPGVVSRRSNGLTPCLPRRWTAGLLRKTLEMDVDVFLAGHGDVGKKKDLQEAIGFLTDLQTAVKDATAKG